MPAERLIQLVRAELGPEYQLTRSVPVGDSLRVWIEWRGERISVDVPNELLDQDDPDATGELARTIRAAFGQAPIADANFARYQPRRASPPDA